ncbi:hypothetical protein PZA11_000061 [Diplocarpon coronariae]|nr:hypothetical protein JHW43_007847 [Diplocarpon mali]
MSKSHCPGLIETYITTNFHFPHMMAYIWSGIAIIMGLITYWGLSGSKQYQKSKKAQQALAMKQAYMAMNNRKAPNERLSTSESAASKPDALKISQLWVYPIKSLRGCQVSSAMMTREGFYLDRRFMLLRDHEETPPKLENMQISKIASMCLFHTSIGQNKLVVTYRAPGSKSTSKADSIDIPLDLESFENLEKIPIEMYGSRTTGYNVGDIYGKWFSERFGFKVVLAFWGGNPRPVLGNLPGKPTNHGPKAKNAIAKIFSSVPVLGSMLNPDDYGIAFNDCAPYHVISESSVANVTKRLPLGVEMDLTKFRANIVLEGSPDAWSEDFWAELTFSNDSSRILLTGNCGRCKSLNVDYHTGENGTGKDGEVLKLLQLDRRVDPGVKYSPIFGRYGFVEKGGEGSVLRVGDEVFVSRKNKERTKFYWPGVSTPW